MAGAVLDGSLPAKILEAEHRVTAELTREAGLSVIDLVDAIIAHARLQNSSDIHIDPHQDDILVRFRIDGLLREAYRIPKYFASEIISRIKVLAELRTDEHYTAQDGRFRMHIDSGDVDVRVSIVPTFYGENAVLRLLVNQTGQFTLDVLGFSDDNKKKILQAIRRPFGMVLVTGPTGSGKTTTLYTLIHMLNIVERSIVTIEDPIEYAIEGVEQIQTNARTGLTFANGLRSILRQDPNIVMVGEIRDSETAGIAVNTALTGHLVLSTLHTNDAATTLPRLLDMKIESYLISSTVNVVIAQRLVRKICEFCKIEKQLTEVEQKSLPEALASLVVWPGSMFYVGAGCGQCLGTGFAGRIGLYEVLVPSEEVRQAIMLRATTAEIRRLAEASGMVTILADGLNKALAGLTTIDEVVRILYE